MANSDLLYLKDSTGIVKGLGKVSGRDPLYTAPEGSLRTPPMAGVTGFGSQQEALSNKKDCPH